MKNIIVKSIIAAFTLVSLGANAADFNDYAGKWGLGAGVGYGLPLGDTDSNGFEEEVNGAVWLRYNINSSWAIDLDYDRIEFDADNATGGVSQARFDHTNVMGTYRFMPNSSWTPVLGLGVGIAETRDTTNGLKNKVEDLGLKGRVGIHYAATKALSVSLNADYHWADLDETTSGDDFTVETINPQLGVTYYFGAAPVAAAAAAVAVAADPARGDADADGVYDDEDRCPGTPAGKSVNSLGCAKAEKFDITLDVKFPTNSANVGNAYAAELSAFAAFMSANKKVTAEIQGHTDSRGSKAYNVSLSSKRAKAVRNYLVNKLGVDASRLTSNGYGPDQPISDNSTSAGRAQNRRVVANVAN